jgi:hypothetical protein
MTGKRARIEVISPRPEGKYRFTVRMKAAAAMPVTINALGSWDTFDVGTSWEAYSIVIDTPASDFVDIYPLADTTLYVEKAQLTFGEGVFDWRPAPEDDVTYAWTQVAAEEVTAAIIRDITGYTDYYQLADTSAAPPAKPTTNPPPAPWTTTEPTLDTPAGLTKTLYRCALTEYSDGTFAWNDVTVDTSYEAAKAAVGISIEYKTIVEQLLDSWRVAVESTTVETDTGKPLAYLLGQIRVTDQTISNLIEETRATADGISERISSVQEQTSTEITNMFTEAKAYTDGQYGDTREYVKTAQAWQRFSAAGIEQGRLGSPFRSILTNEELGFYENNQKVAYINNNRFMITNGEIIDTLNLGQFAFAAGSNGLGIVWNGNGGNA